MPYIKLITLILILFFSACSTQPEKTASSFNKKNTTIKKIKPLSPAERKLYKQALTELYNNKLDNAEYILKKFQKNRPDLSGPLANLGLIYYKKSNYKKAKEILQKSLKLNPNLSESFNLLGMIEVKNGNIQKAEKFYLQALKHKNNYANAHYNIALLYDIYLQNIEKAILHYKQYMVLSKTKDKITQEWLEQLENSLKNKE